MKYQCLVPILLSILLAVIIGFLLLYQPKWTISQRTLDGAAISMAKGEALKLLHHLRVTQNQNTSFLSGHELTSLELPATIDLLYFESVIGATYEEDIWNLTVIAKDSNNTTISVSESSEEYKTRFEN